MIVRRVKYIDGDGSQVFEIGESGYDIRYFKVTTIWLFGIIPIYYSKAQMSVIAPRTQWGYSLSNVHLLQHYTNSNQMNCIS